MITRINRWLRLRILRAELRDIDREEQQAKDVIARAWMRRAERVKEIETLEGYSDADRFDVEAV